MRERDPEAVAYAREAADWGKFEVAVLKDGDEIGTLDETFHNDYDASVAAHEAQIPDVGITTDVRSID